MPTNINEVRQQIGTSKFNEIKAFAKKAKAEGLSPAQVKVVLRKKYRKLERTNSASEVIGVILRVTGGGVGGGQGK